LYLWIFPLTLPLSPGDCVVIGKMVKNVMLNLVQHLMESISYETLKRVQGDKKIIATQSPEGRGEG
jgi:hypothetical protein